KIRLDSPATLVDWQCALGCSVLLQVAVSCCARSSVPYQRLAVVSRLQVQITNALPGGAYFWPKAVCARPDAACLLTYFFFFQPFSLTQQAATALFILNSSPAQASILVKLQLIWAIHCAQR